MRRRANSEAVPGLRSRAGVSLFKWRTAVLGDAAEGAAMRACGVDGAALGSADGWRREVEGPSDRGGDKAERAGVRDKRGVRARGAGRCIEEA